MLKLKLLFLKYKCKISIFLIFFLFVSLLLKGGVYYLEKKKEVVPRSVSYIESKDIFSDSTPYVIKEGQDGLRETTYKIWKDWSEEVYDYKELKPMKEETRMRGTLRYKDYEVDIRNQITKYIGDVINKRFNKLNSYYIDFSKVEISDSKKNWLKLMKIKGNFILDKTTPLYEYYSTKAITKTKLNGEYYDSIKRKKFNYLNVFSIYDSKKGEFKIINPEYIELDINTRDNNHKIVNLISSVNKYSAHNLEIEIKKEYLKFPNHLLFYLENHLSKNIKYNRVKIELYKEWKLLYSEKKEINDFNKETFGKTNWRKKSAYKLNYWVDIDFDKKHFSTIYDKIMENWILKMNKLILKITPINDSDVSLDYPTYEFKL